jgi:hypothetical protein
MILLMHFYYYHHANMSPGNIFFAWNIPEGKYSKKDNDSDSND